MTDNKIKRIFRRFVKSKITELFAWLNQSVTLILVPSSHRHPITLKFRPLWPIMLCAILAVVGWRSAVVLSNNTKARLAKASLAGELDVSRKALDDIHNQIESMVQLMDRFQNTVSPFNSESQESGLGTDYSAQDFTDITAAVGIMGSGNMNDVDRLKLLNASIENSMAPLKESLSLLGSQQRLLRELPTMWPVKNHNQASVSFLFGPNLDPISRGRWYLHRGLDIAGPPGTVLVAAAGGKVVEVDYSPTGYGNYVIIKHKYGIYTLYAHQQRVFVRVGDIVSQGDTLGLLGATGRVTGPHVHFEVRIGSQIVDPIVYLRMSDINRKQIDAFFDRNRRVRYMGRD
ncbi:MAG: M23 family metallopeptidase [Spirochaetota bacterium]